MRRPLVQHRNVFAQSCVCRSTKLMSTRRTRNTNLHHDSTNPIRDLFQRAGQA